MLDGSVKLLMEGTAWELLNIPIDHAIDLFNDLLTATNQNLGRLYKLQNSLTVFYEQA